LAQATRVLKQIVILAILVYYYYYYYSFVLNSNDTNSNSDDSDDDSSSRSSSRVSSSSNTNNARGELLGFIEPVPRTQWPAAAVFERRKRRMSMMSRMSEQD